ncbi:MAG: DUF397 domain-containing protein [Pseudonocardiaceae bacterium]
MGKVPLPPSAAFWRKSSASGAGECVQFTCSAEHVWVRDSKNPLGPALGFNSEEWAEFLAGVQRGEFDRPG